MTRVNNIVNFGTWTAGLAGLTADTIYYARSYGIANTSNGVETFYGNEITFTTSATLGPGDYYEEEGGVIFYVLQPGDSGYDPNELHGLILSIEFPSLPGSSTTFNYGCQGTLLSSTSQELFTGLNNTNQMLNSCPNSTAALACINYSFMGLNDWYLPSAEEVLLIYEKRANINSTILNFSAGDIIGPSVLSSSESLSLIHI